MNTSQYIGTGLMSALLRYGICNPTNDAKAIPIERFLS